MKLNIPIEKLNFNRAWFSYTDLNQMGFLNAKITDLSSDKFTLVIDKSKTHYGVDYSDMKFVSRYELYEDKSDLTIEYNLKELLEYSNIEFETAVKTFNEMNKAFKKNKQIRKENKLNVLKFKETFAGMELPETFYKDHCKRRYDIVYIRKARKLVKKFKKAINENKITLKSLSK